MNIYRITIDCYENESDYQSDKYDPGTNFSWDINAENATEAVRRAEKEFRQFIPEIPAGQYGLCYRVFCWKVAENVIEQVPYPS